VSKADQYENYAANCSGLAEAANRRPDRTRFLRMEQSWLALAENEHWLVGSRSPLAITPIPA